MALKELVIILVTCWIHRSSEKATLRLLLERDMMMLSNNSIVDLDIDQNLLCCSTDSQSTSDDLTWLFPNGSTITNDISTRQRSYSCNALSLHRIGTDTSGIFSCNTSKNEVDRQTLFVGIYDTTEGIISISNMSYSASTSSILCVSSGGPATNVSWAKLSMTGYSTPLEPPQNQQTKVVESTTLGIYHSTLHGIRNGTFMCTVSNIRNSESSICYVVKSLKVTDNDSIPAIAGQDYHLTCRSPDIQNLPMDSNYSLSYSWMKDNDTLNSTSRTLSFSPLRENDSGAYTCVVRSNCMTEDVTANITITVRQMTQTTTTLETTTSEYDSTMTTSNSSSEFGLIDNFVTTDTSSTITTTTLHRDSKLRLEVNIIPLIAIIASAVAVVFILALCIPIMIKLRRCSKRDKAVVIKRVNISQPLLDYDQQQLSQYLKTSGEQSNVLEMTSVSMSVSNKEPERNIRDREKPVQVTDFFKHVEQMHSDRDRLFEEEYNSLSSDPQYPHNMSQMPCNQEKNRFINIFPYDYNRVKLNEIPAIEGSDYMNASFLNGYRKQGTYIAAQGPLPNTLEDFWRMIWEYRLPTIVMLTKCFEERPKCERYWPENKEEEFRAGPNFTVKLVSSIPFSEFLIRNLTVECRNQPRLPALEVTQFHYTAWPDHGVPSNTSVLLNIIKRIRKLHPYSESRPLMVHCSAGVGRTGTFVVLDTMLERMKKEKSINVYEFVKQLRTERVFMVQSLAQYMFIHDSLMEFTLCGETEILAPNLGIAVNKLKKSKRGQTGFEQQFQTLEKLCPKLDNESFTNAREECNVSKNRYPDKLPCDGFSHVALRWTGQQGSDYINASYIDGYKQRRVYIATQCPMESTVDDFWRMVWEQKACCIVMLCDLEEGDKEMSVHYWPADQHQQTFNKVTVKKLTQSRSGSVVTRTFEIDSSNQQGASSSLHGVKSAFTVTQFQFLTWTEHSCPSDVSALLDLVENVSKIQMKSKNKPIIIMCNDGVGRSGAFICIHAQLERLKTEGAVDFFQCVKSCRFQRPRLMLDVNQYELCHLTLLQYLQSCDDYANFKDVM